ncbi:DEAD/DEAH box helicase [Leptospira sp. WS60.C2]
MMSELTINIIRKSRFQEIYSKLFTEEINEESEFQSILTIGLLFLNSDNYLISQLGYRILIRYSILSKNTIPLYEVSSALNFTPINKLLENKISDFETADSFYKTFLSSSFEFFRDKDTYLTAEQLNLKNFYIEKINQSLAIVAPTSYGKSELIISTISLSPKKNICILVPTKALLAQIKSRIISSKDFKQSHKVITHPDSYKKIDLKYVAIFTQERLIQFLETYKEFRFDIIVIDEAHNLLERNDRSETLSLALALLEKRNKSSIFKFLTPFLVDSNNLQIYNTNYSLIEYKINEKVKIEKYYLIDFNKNGNLKIYDQFLDCFFALDKSFDDYFQFLKSKSSKKNIIYFNVPSDIENFAEALVDTIPKVSNEEIEKACKDLARFIHKEYNLIKALETGIVYHHGSVPDSIRLYVENLYSKITDIKYIVTSSTLLEGVNIPGESLFLFDYQKGRRKLTASQMKNLVGRVCRFREIFHAKNGDIKMLEPSIYLIGSKYTRKGANLEKFYKDTVKVDKKITDDLENILLNNARLSSKDAIEKEKLNEFFYNLDPDGERIEGVNYSNTLIGRYCFENNIHEIEILQNEENIKEQAERFTNLGYKVGNPKELLEAISLIFIPFIKENDKNLNILRLKQNGALKFYSLFLNWKIQAMPYKLMIRNFLNYWRRIEKNSEEILVYVGKWGDTRKDNANVEHWVRISEKTYRERVNLAIVKIKEEQDFVDNKLFKFIEVLYKMQIIEEDFYLKIKYGTSDKVKIILIKNGISLALASLLSSVEYFSFVDIDFITESLKISPQIVGIMENRNVNEILIFEVKMNLG